MFGVQWVLPEKGSWLLCAWRSRGPNLEIWNITPLGLWRTIWRERNQWTFEDMECTPPQLQASFISSLCGLLYRVS